MDEEEGGSLPCGHVVEADPIDTEHLAGLLCLRPVLGLVAPYRLSGVGPEAGEGGAKKG